MARFELRRGACSRAVRFFWLILVALVLFSGLLSSPASAEEPLRQGFANPPHEARPWVYWFWINGTMTREGITADLEAMDRVGIGGALIMNVGDHPFTPEFPPAGPAEFLTPKWLECFRHAVDEAERLGLEIIMTNDDGWTGSGGPWIEPDEAMQKLVWSETRVNGPGEFSRKLPQPPTLIDYYRDVAVLAFPTLEGDHGNLAPLKPNVTADTGELDGAQIVDGDMTTAAGLQSPQNRVNYLNLTFPEPLTARAVTIAIPEESMGKTWRADLQVSENGQDWRTVRAVDLRWKRWHDVTKAAVCPASTTTGSFPAVTSRFFRLKFWLVEEIRVAEVLLTGADRVHYWEPKSGQSYMFGHGGGSAQIAERGGGQPAPEGAVVRAESLVDLTDRIDADGRLQWDVPEGEWTILRIGYTPTGQQNLPATDTGRGLECDKLSRHGVEAHFPHVLGRLTEKVGDATGETLIGGHVDSWELGAQNCTADLTDEFRRRCGYDLETYLPVMAGGRVVGSEEVSERFLWDLRRTMADLIAEEYYARLGELCHEHGLDFSAEPCGAQQFLYDSVGYYSIPDLPMGEFWEGSGLRKDCKAAGSVAQVYDRPVAGVEAYTSGVSSKAWQRDPFTMKGQGDLAFCSGVNRMVFHRYAQQPWIDRKPGMTFSRWGIHFERTLTWWEQGAAWMDYLARSQFMLQRGRQVTDVCCLSSEGVPAPFNWANQFSPPIPAGYDFAVCSNNKLRQMTVRDGKILLPGGQTYRVLLLPDEQAMTPERLEQVARLVKAGATVIGPKPERSPSLKDYPAGDRRVEALAEDVWADCDGKSVKKHAYGKGKICWGKSLEDVFAEMGVPPDFEYRGAGEAELEFIHRRTEHADIYFVSNQSAEPVRANCLFRVSGRIPEFWRPDSATVSDAAVYAQRDERTSVPLRFEPYGSVFVVFRRSANGKPFTAVARNGELIQHASAGAPQAGADRLVELRVLTDGKTEARLWKAGTYDLKRADGKSLTVSVEDIPDPLEIRGPWEVRFPEGWGAPDRVTLDRLTSWTEHTDPGVRYFSGTATYVQEFKIPAERLGEGRILELDLGELKNLAEVMLNGRDLGVLWKKPFAVDITDAAKPGKNTLEVRVTNLWPNRLIGDQHLPEDERYTYSVWNPYTRDSELLPSGLFGPVRVRSGVRKTVSSTQ